MVIIIGGASHSGKTFLSKKLIEKYKIPCTNLDHIKMGLIRGFNDCGFSAVDSDETIAEKMWGFIEGFIGTCIENNQNTILEGCYFPCEKVKKLLCDDLTVVFIVLSKQYIIENFDKIIKYENIVEDRKFPESREIKFFINENERIKEECIKYELPYFEITDNYFEGLEKILEYIKSKAVKICRYSHNDINEICSMFCDTVKHINKRDYTAEQIAAWMGGIDKDKWDKSLSEHFSLEVKVMGKIAAFGDIDGEYLDRLYVHKDFQGLGYGKIILDSLEEQAIQSGFKRIWTCVSITAKGFFERYGYKVIKRQQVERKDVLLTNYVMEKHFEQEYSNGI